MTRACLVFVVFLLVACADNKTTPDPNNMVDPTTMTTGPTYHGAVRPLLADNCGGCHLPGGIAPFSFDEYETTKPLATLIANAVMNKTMPPWGLHDTAECSHRPVQDDIRLTDAQIDTLMKWADNGAPEGEVPAAVTPFEAKVSALPRVDQTLTPATGFTTQGTNDQFRCFVLDPGNAQTIYLRGVRFAPGNEKVVHHAIVYSDASGASDALADANGQYDCFGGPGFADATLVSAWAPGGVPSIYPDTASMPIVDGTKLVLQIHYHPTGSAPESDLTSVELMFDRLPTEYLAAASFIGNFSSGFNEDEGLLPGPNDNGSPEFMIPAGMNDHTETMRLRIPFRIDGQPFEGAYILAVANHMHYVGRDMKVELIRGSNDAPCTSTEVEPLTSCLDTNCPGATSLALSECIEDSCPDTLNALTAFCGSCLEHRFIENDAAFLTSCQSPIPMPTKTFGPIPDQPASECFLHTPNWNFEWQRAYQYSQPITDLPFVRPGDTFELRCTYDNTMGNSFVREALTSQGLTAPRDVVLGEETLDEMCLVAVSFLFKE